MVFMVANSHNSVKRLRDFCRYVPHVCFCIQLKNQNRRTEKNCEKKGNLSFSICNCEMYLTKKNETPEMYFVWSTG